MHSPLKMFWQAVIVTACAVTMSSTHLKAEEQIDNPAKEVNCQKPLKIKGPANQIQSMAELQTIIIWTEKVTEKFTKNYAQWHNAKQKKIKCRRSSGSRYYYCELSAMPCKSTDLADYKKQETQSSETLTPEREALNKNLAENERYRTGKIYHRKTRNEISTP